MSTEKNVDLESWAKKATQRLQDKLVIKHREIEIPALETKIKIRNLTYAEVIDTTEIDTSEDPNKGDKYAVYTAIVEPDMRALATELKKAGEITDYYDVCNMFELHELNFIAKEIMKLSGVSPDGKNNMSVVETLKN